MTQLPRPWHKKPLVIIGTLVTFPILGIPLLWRTQLPRPIKIAGSLFSLIMLRAILFQPTPTPVAEVVAAPPSAEPSPVVPVKSVATPIASPSPQPVEVVVEETSWSDKLCKDGRYLPVNGASTAIYSSCQYININSIPKESIVLATVAGNEDIADQMVSKGYKKVNWRDDFSPLNDKSTSACIVYKDRSVACHKGTDTPAPETVQASIEAISDEATLSASDPKSQINLRATPSADGKLLGYGLVGDRVLVTGLTTIESVAWYRVKFPKSGATGWIHGDFIFLDSADEGDVPAPSASAEPVQTYPAPVTSGSGGGRGNCQYPDDLDSRGRRCGKKAASERPGGN